MGASGLQRYQVMESVGRGGQGHTYRGIDRETGADVAIKVLSLPGQANWKAFDLFEREVATLASLDHPGIPHYHASYSSEETGDYFLVMDLVKGTPLSSVIAEGRTLSQSELRSISDQTLDILAYLHGRVPPVIHRDLKPANMILGDDGRISLVDFGGVRVAVKPGGGSTMIGTFGYMAPEQLHGEAGPGTDIYALGATVAALAAGCEADLLPRDGLTIQLDGLFPAGPFRAVLEGMLQPNPRDRLADAPAVRAALQGAESGSLPTRSAPGGEDELKSRGGLLPADTVQELAELPTPIRLVIWLASALAAGFLMVAEIVLFPLVYAIVGATGVTKRHPELKGRLREVRRSLRGGRQHARELAAHTDPNTPTRRAVSSGRPPREE